MGRGKIEIKKIESIRNRQVSFSKRKGGLLKKAHELSVLTEAQIGLVIFSASGKLYEYSSNNSSVAEIFDKYKKATHFCMQDHNSSSNQELLEEIRRLKHEKAELETCLRQLTVLDLKDHSISEFQHKTPSRRQVAEKQGEREMGFLEGQFSHFGENSYSGLLQLGPQMNPFQMGPTQPNLNGDQIGHYLQLW